MRRFRLFPSSRAFSVLTVLAVLAAGLAALYAVMARGLPEAGILVVDLRHALPDKARAAPDGRRSVSAVDVLRALDAARGDRRIAGLYLRVGGGGMPLAQAAEIADAVLRVRAAGKFAVVWSGGFTSANLSDRVLAAAADEVWTRPRSELPDANARIVPPAEEPRPPSLAGGQADLWRNLLGRARHRIAEAAQGEIPSSVHEVARSGGLPQLQLRRGPEGRAEQAALAWGGADAQFIGLLAYRDVLTRRAAGTPVVALVQAEGVLDILEGSETSELAGPLAEKIRMAAKDTRVKGVIIRISAPAASGEALSLLTRAVEDARRAGTPAGFSFGPLVPSSAATLRADLPALAAGGAILVNAAPAEAAALAEQARSPWRAENEVPSAEPYAAEFALLKRGAALAAIGANGRPAAPALPAHENPLPSGGAEAGIWQGDVGTLLDLKDRLSGGNGAGALALAPYEDRRPILERTAARFTSLWRWLSGWAKRPAGAAQTTGTGQG